MRSTGTALTGRESTTPPGRGRSARATSRAKRVGEGCVSTEDYAMAFGLDQVTVEAAVGIGAHSGAPMLHSKTQNAERSYPDTLTPADFLDAFVASGSQQVAGVGRRDYHGA